MAKTLVGGSGGAAAAVPMSAAVRSLENPFIMKLEEGTGERRADEILLCLGTHSPRDGNDEDVIYNFQQRGSPQWFNGSTDTQPNLVVISSESTSGCFDATLGPAVHDVVQYGDARCSQLLFLFWWPNGSPADLVTGEVGVKWPSWEGLRRRRRRRPKVGEGKLQRHWASLRAMIHPWPLSRCHDATRVPLLVGKSRGKESARQEKLEFFCSLDAVKSVVSGAGDVWACKMSC